MLLIASSPRILTLIYGVLNWNISSLGLFPYIHLPVFWIGLPLLSIKHGQITSDYGSAFAVGFLSFFPFFVYLDIDYWLRSQPTFTLPVISQGLAVSFSLGAIGAGGAIRPTLNTTGMAILLVGIAIWLTLFFSQRLG